MGEQPPPAPESDLTRFLLSAPVRAWLAGVDDIESRLSRTIRHVPSCACGNTLDPRCEAQSKQVTDPAPDEQ